MDQDLASAYAAALDAVLAEGPLAQVQADERVVEVYLGR